jgi:hypothetical protein
MINIKNMKKDGQKVSKWKQPKRPVNKPSDEPPCTFVINWADLQLGKSAGGGVEATVERVLESLEKTVQQLHDLRRKGRNIEGRKIHGASISVLQPQGMAVFYRQANESRKNTPMKSPAAPPPLQTNVPSLYERRTFPFSLLNCLIADSPTQPAEKR